MKACHLLRTVVVPLILVLACRDSSNDADGSARRSLPAVYSLGPANNTNWNENAGPVMLLPMAAGSDSVAIVLPGATDSTIEAFESTTPAVQGLVFELLGRSGKIGSSAAMSLPMVPDSTRECSAWPKAKLQSNRVGWAVGFVSGHVRAVPLDSIESLPSSDSAALAASLAQSAATLPISADPIFRRLPFRVQSAYTFTLESVDIVAADVVRSLNEEANPRIEHLFLIGERPTGTPRKYHVAYYNRVAGPEETIQASEILAVVQIGTQSRPAVVLNVESEDGAQLRLVERTARGQWQPTWSSAYTDC
jgi:hypothetical protein